MTDTAKIDDVREFTVEGMTCSQDVSAVRGEVFELPAVRAVDVDLRSGRLRVAWSGIEHDAVRAAVVEAGYVR